MGKAQRLKSRKRQKQRRNAQAALDNAIRQQFLTGQPVEATMTVHPETAEALKDWMEAQFATERTNG